MAHPPDGRTKSGRTRTGLLIAATALAATALFAAACSFDYAAGGATPEELLDEVPETELFEVTHTVVRNGRVVAEIRARQVQNFPRRGVTELRDVRYTEYDRAGEPVTTGSADFARYHTASEDAEVAGAVRLRSESQGVLLHAAALRWDDERRRLSSDAEQVVEVSRDDGSEARGRGLEVDVRSKTIRFTAPVTGTLVTGGAAPE